MSKCHPVDTHTCPVEGSMSYTVQLKLDTADFKFLESDSYTSYCLGVMPLEVHASLLYTLINEGRWNGYD